MLHQGAGGGNRARRRGYKGDNMEMSTAQLVSAAPKWPENEGVGVLCGVHWQLLFKQPFSHD